MNWPIKRLDELMSIERGGSPRPIQQYITDKPNGLNWIKIGDATLSGKYIYETKEKIRPEGLKKSRFVEKGDFLLSNSMSFGRPYIMGTSGCIHDGWLVLKDTSGLLDKDYLYYALSSPVVFEQFDQLAAGSTVRNLNTRLVAGVTIPVPSKTEQQRIVKKLDAAFAALSEAQALVERNRANARELFESYLNGVFEGKGGWEAKTLGELGKISMCKRIMKHETSPAGDIPFYKIGTFGKAPDAFIPKEIYQEFKKKYPYPKKGDVLISASGTIGRGVVFNGQPAYFQDSNIVWIDNNEEQVLNEYLYQFYKVCDWNPSKGATISRLYNDDLRRIKISFPSVHEQKKLVAHMVELDAQTQVLETTYDQKLSELEELKKSILGAAFNGQL